MNAGQIVLFVSGILLRLLVVTLCAVLQTSLFTRFHLLGAVPDLMGAYVLALSYFKNDRYGMVAGLCGGFLVDALSGAGISIQCLFYPLISLFFGNSDEDLRAGDGESFGRFCLIALIVTGIRTVLEVVLRFIGGGLSAAIMSFALWFFLFTLPFALFVKIGQRIVARTRP